MQTWDEWQNAHGRRSSAELNSYLQAELGEAEIDSSGVFTVSLEQALEKLAGFQLPGEHSWVMKVVQSAVASRCFGLQVRQTASETQFAWAGPPAWSADQVEHAFCDPVPGKNRSLEHLKQALWSVGLAGLRPFYLVGTGWRQALLWDGRRLRRCPLEPSDQTSLTVSHRVWQKGQGFPVLRSIEAARRNAEVLLELKQRAFVCPVPLQLDGLRLDALQACPSHGMSRRSSILRLSFVQGDLPPLRVPPATADFVAESGEMRSDLRAIFRAPQHPPEASVLCLLTAHLAQVADGTRQVWRSGTHSNRLYWVLDGVVVDQLSLSLPNRCCSLALIASAEGLVTDLTGFALQVNSAYRQRLWRVYELAATFVGAVSLDFSGLEEQSRGGWFARLRARPESSPSDLAREFETALTQVRRDWYELLVGMKGESKQWKYPGTSRG